MKFKIEASLIECHSDSNLNFSNDQDGDSPDVVVTEANGTLTVVDPQPAATPSADLLGDLLGPLAIEGPPGATVEFQHNLGSGLAGDPNTEEALALAPVAEQMNTVQVLIFA